MWFIQEFIQQARIRLIEALDFPTFEAFMV